MSRMWEVDPETRTKLLQISKTNGNDRCCDCGAPSPQWASPKFGTFICLNCAGTHRGLGVHISFVRSITMDAFKHAEIQRMEQGGNEPWKAFYDAHPVTTSEGRTFEDSTIKERYEGDAGEEWKERLSCKVEGREYVLGQEKKNNVSSRSSTPMSGSGAGAGVGAGSGPRTGSPATSIRSDSIRSGANSKKEQNEAYFAKLGNDNATRSDALPPSQGGKFTGFGGGMPPPSAGDRRSSPFGGFGGWGAFGGGGGAPGLDEFQKDPMASLSKGFGWFASTVGKGAKTVNDSYLQPTAKQLAESDFAAQARVQATNWGQNFQSGARNAADQFNRFVEGDDGGHGSSRSRVEPERRDFWDDFSSIGAQQQQQQQQQQEMSGHQRSGSRSGVIGTAAMRKGPTPAASSLSNETTAPSGVEGADAPTKSKTKEKDDWDDNW